MKNSFSDMKPWLLKGTTTAAYRPLMVTHSTEEPLKNLCEPHLDTDLQFPKPPTRGVLAEDEDELAIFQIELFRAGRGVGPEHLGDLCAHKDANTAIIHSKTQNQDLCPYESQRQRDKTVSLPGFFFPDVLDVYKKF